MKSLQLLGYGKLAEQLQLRDGPTPTVGPQDVLIEVHAASINPIDFKLMKGDLKLVLPQKFPAPVGFDASGVVAAVGAQVQQFKVGDTVYARAPRQRMGSFAEQLAVAAQYVTHKPRTLSHVEAASIPLVGLTTVQGLVDRARAQAGQSILIQAGSGGVGTFAIQYAKRVLGLKVATTTSSRNAEWVRALGADAVICYDRENYLDMPERFDMVFDMLGGAQTLEAFKVLKPGGAVISIAGPPSTELAQQVRANAVLRFLFWVLSYRVEQQAAQKSARYYRFLTESSGPQLQAIGALIDAGQIKPIIDRTYPFEQIITALEYAAQGRAKGKVVVQMRD